MIKTKIAILGAGISGITAAIYLKSMNLDFLIVEGNEIGGKLNSLKTIENFPGLASTSGAQIAKDLKSQIDNLKIDVYKGNVQTILKSNEGFEVILDTEKIICEKIIYALGNGNINSSILGEEKYFGSGVSYCAVCDGNFFKNKKVAVIGNNEIAISEALYLSNLCSEIILISPRELLGSESLIFRLKNITNIKIIENKIVDEIIGDDFGVTGIKIKDQIIGVDGVFIYYGKKNSNLILKNINPKMNNRCLVVNENMETNIKGLYAVGDIVDKKLKQLITASNDGAIAAITISKQN